MKTIKYTAVTLVITAMTPSIATGADLNQDAKWKFAVSAGAVSMPAYLGADSQQLSAALDLQANYGDKFFASFAQGVGFNLLNQGGWRLGPIAKYDIGRRENGDNPFFINGDKTADLKGLGDIEGTAELGGFIEYSYEYVKGRIETRNANEGHKGTITEATFSYNTSVEVSGKEAFLTIETGFVYGDRNYNMAFFGVDPQQAKASGLAEYYADSGCVSQSINLTIAVPIEDHISLIGFVKYSRLDGDGKNSPLVVNRGSPNQTLTGMLINYAF